VDCVVPANISPEQLTALFKRHRKAIGADVARCLSGHIVLAGKNADGSACFVDLDFGDGYDPEWASMLRIGRQFGATLQRVVPSSGDE
jgi:hypothetical protein